jgi:preprotein translocase subunit SecG
MTSLFIFLTVVQALIGAGLVGLILMQKSEGGGLGVGGSPAGLMSARGAADFMTRATVVFATLFVALSIVLAVLAVKASTAQKVDTSLVRAAPAALPAAAPVAPAPVAPADPLAGAAKK